jgi:nucleotide-binding universal stress UspA family protein
MSRIVVGVDGSSEARRALEWAIAEAATRGVALTAVHVHALPHLEMGDVLPSDYDLRRGAERVLEAELAEVEAPPGVQVERRTRMASGNPASVLVEEARGADLLVVGSRGLGGFMALLLGSVSEQCVTHATCPVVVVPGGESLEARRRRHAEMELA